MFYIENKVKTLCQPGGTAIITTNVVSPRITDSGVDPHGMGRCSYITINRQNEKMYQSLALTALAKLASKKVDPPPPSLNNYTSWKKGKTPPLTSGSR